MFYIVFTVCFFLYFCCPDNNDINLAASEPVAMNLAAASETLNSADPETGFVTGFTFYGLCDLKSIIIKQRLRCLGEGAWVWVLRFGCLGLDLRVWINWLFNVLLSYILTFIYKYIFPHQLSSSCYFFFFILRLHDISYILNGGGLFRDRGFCTLCEHQ